jgi:hypothetical protein
VSDDRRDWFHIVGPTPDFDPTGADGAIAWLRCRACGTWFLPIDHDDELTELLELVDDHQADCEYRDSDTRVIPGSTEADGQVGGGTVGS